MTSAGGIIIYPRGIIIAHFSSCMGLISNNFSKAYVLWRGIRIGTRKGIQEVIILGYFMLVIQSITKKSNVGNNLFIGVFSHILSFLSEYDDYRDYHIMRDQNHLVDHWAKYGLSLGEG